MVDIKRFMLFYLIVANAYLEQDDMVLNSVDLDKFIS